MDVSQPKRKAEDPGGDEAAEAALRAARPPPPPPTAAAPAAPPPLGDHSSYMLEALLPLADVRLKTSGGRALPAHANVLIAQCGALARASELLAAGSRERPVVLGQPFEGCSEADAAAFLGCLYRPERYKANGAAAAAPAVARLAHALDCASVLELAASHLATEMPSSLADICAALELAEGCDLPAARINAAAAERVVAFLDGGGEALGLAAPTALAASDVESFQTAHVVARQVPRRVLALALGALAAGARRGAAARAAALPPHVPLRLAAADVARLAALSDFAAPVPNKAVPARGGWQVALFSVPAQPRGRPRFGAACDGPGGARLRLVFTPAGRPGGGPGGAAATTGPGVFLSLAFDPARTAPRRVRAEVGILNWRGQPAVTWRIDAVMAPPAAPGAPASSVGRAAVLGAAEFGAPGGGWLLNGRAAVIVRIIDESEAPPAAAAAVVAQVAAAAAAQEQAAAGAAAAAANGQALAAVAALEEVQEQAAALLAGLPPPPPPPPV